MSTCLDLCSLNDLCYIQCACVLHAMFVCLDLGYSFHVMCYCSPFVALVALSCVLAYWFGPDLDPMVFVIIYTPWPISKVLDHPFCMSILTCLYALSSVLVSLVLGFATLKCPQQVCGCVVTSDAHEALFGCNHLGCISRCWVASCIPFPFSLPCDDMLIILVCATRWLSMHLYTLAYWYMSLACQCVIHTVRTYVFHMIKNICQYFM